MTPAEQWEVVHRVEQICAQCDEPDAAINRIVILLSRIMDQSRLMTVTRQQTRELLEVLGDKFPPKTIGYVQHVFSCEAIAETIDKLNKLKRHDLEIVCHGMDNVNEMEERGRGEWIRAADLAAIFGLRLDLHEPNYEGFSV